MEIGEIEFAISKGMELGDRLVRLKGPYSRHHGIYVGIHNGRALVAENQIKKVFSILP